MSRWDRRIERAAELEAEHPEASQLLELYRRIATLQKRLAEANVPREAAASSFVTSLRQLLRQNAPEPMASNPPEEFLARVLDQPYAESLTGPARPTATGRTCPFCGEKPVVAVLRPEGEGAKRSLLCSLCFKEWEYGRLRCANCGEDQEARLPVYTAEQFPHVRLDVCETCRVYIKSVDLTRNGRAVPEVDELAAVALDLWAAERGYAKLQRNLFEL